MKKIRNNKSIQLLLFLALFGFSVGLFNNYRELWMSANEIKPISISRIISFSYFITVLVLFFFTIKVTTSKLKYGITISLILKMITSSLLICLNESNHLFLIKFLMFFDIAFTELILSSIYPLMMNIAKNDVIYTRKEVVESLFNKLGFLLASMILGHTIGSHLLDYNSCYLLSLIFNFIAFMVIININVEIKREDKPLDIKESYHYFKKNKVFLLFILTNIASSIAWSAIMGMPLLTLTEKLSFRPNIASYIILGVGIASNILAMLIVKYFRFKNDHINLIFKFGLRVILYLSVFLTGSKELLLITLIYLLLTDCTYNFLFSGYFINKIEEKYSLLLVVLKYCSSLIGNGIGVFICGLLFHLEIKYLALPSLIIGIIHYIMATILINKKREKVVS